MSDESKFFSYIKDNKYKEHLINSLSKNIEEKKTEAFKNLINYIIDNKISFLNDIEYTIKLYDDENPVVDVFLPAIRLLWVNFFIKVPPIISNKKDRLKLYQSYFDIDEFILYYREIYDKVKISLKDFENIDRTSETQKLIVDNYVSGILKKVIECDSSKVKKNTLSIQIDKLINGIKIED